MERQSVTAPALGQEQVLGGTTASLPPSRQAQEGRDSVTNPARRLADLLEAFAVPAKEYPETVRAAAFGVEVPEDLEPEDMPEFWRHQAAVIDLVREVDGIVQSLARSGTYVTPFEQTLPSWYRAAFSFATPWTTKRDDNRPCIDRADLMLLQSLAITLDVARIAEDSPEADHARLTQALGEVEGLISAATTLPVAMLRYLLSLVHEARLALQDYGRFGSTPARRVTFMLAGAMEAAVESGAVPESEAGKWRDAIRTVLVAWVSAAGIALGGSYAAPALGMGQEPPAPPPNTTIVIQQAPSAPE